MPRCRRPPLQQGCDPVHGRHGFAGWYRWPRMKCSLVAIADIAQLLTGQGTIAANLRPWLNRMLDERFEHGYERAAGMGVIRSPGRRESTICRAHWPGAKARFSELVRRVRSEGPQHVSVHGRDEVVLVSAEEFRRLEGSRTGQALIDALQSAPRGKLDFAPARAPLKASMP